MARFLASKNSHNRKNWSKFTSLTSVSDKKLPQPSKLVQMYRIPRPIECGSFLVSNSEQYLGATRREATPCNLTLQPNASHIFGSMACGLCEPKPHGLHLMGSF